MKVEKISDTSLEILLTKTELREKNINVDDLLDGDIKAQKIIYELMEEAEKNHNITIKSNGLFKMNILNHNNGDVSIIISAFNSSEEKIDLYKQLYKQLEQNLPLYSDMLNKYSAKDVEDKIQQKISSFSKDNKNTVMVYEFVRLQDIKDILETIHINFKNEIVYKWHNKYYLILHLKIGSSKKKVESFLSEFANLNVQPNFENILYEHGEKIIKGDAKNILKTYF